MKNKLQINSACGETAGVGIAGLLVPGARVRTHLGETGTVLGKLWTGQYEVEIDNSEDKQLVKRWLGNMREIYSAHDVTLLSPNTKTCRGPEAKP